MTTPQQAPRAASVSPFDHGLWGDEEVRLLEPIALGCLCRLLIHERIYGSIPSSHDVIAKIAGLDVPDFLGPWGDLEMMWQTPESGDTSRLVSRWGR